MIKIYHVAPHIQQHTTIARSLSNLSDLWCGCRFHCLASWKRTFNDIQCTCFSTGIVMSLTRLPASKHVCVHAHEKHTTSHDTLKIQNIVALRLVATPTIRHGHFLFWELDDNSRSKHLALLTTTAFFCNEDANKFNNPYYWAMRRSLIYCPRLHNRTWWAFATWPNLSVHMSHLIIANTTYLWWEGSWRQANFVRTICILKLFSFDSETRATPVASMPKRSMSNVRCWGDFTTHVLHSTTKSTPENQVQNQDRMIVGFFSCICQSTFPAHGKNACVHSRLLYFQYVCSQNNRNQTNSDWKHAHFGISMNHHDFKSLKETKAKIGMSIPKWHN